MAPTSRLPDRFRIKAIPTQLAASDKDLIVMAKAIYDEVKSFTESRVKDVEAEAARRVSGLFEKEMDSRADVLRTEMKSLTDAVRADFKLQLTDVAETFLDKIRAMISAMPMPQVILPPECIRMEMGSITVPSEAILVNVGKPVIHINVPQGPAPTVDFKFPELAPPTVNVTVPPPRRTRKSIEYDQHGRPTEIEEREIE